MISDVQQPFREARQQDSCSTFPRREWQAYEYCSVIQSPWLFPAGYESMFVSSLSITRPPSLSVVNLGSILIDWIYFYLAFDCHHWEEFKSYKFEKDGRSSWWQALRVPDDLSVTSWQKLWRGCMRKCMFCPPFTGYVTQIQWARFDENLVV